MPDLPARVGVCIVLLAVLPAAARSAPPATAEQTRERQSFLAAEAALDAGHRSEFRRLLSGLRDYPLYPYLVAEDLEHRLGAARVRDIRGEIRSFLDQFGDVPAADRVRAAWLRRLAARAQWPAFLEFYRPTDDTVLRCLRARALFKLGRDVEAARLAGELWLSGRSQPEQCDPVFAAWRDAGALTRDAAWRRVRLALKAGQPHLARYLERFLPSADRRLVDTWLDVRRHPELLRTDAVLTALASPDPHAGRILVDALSHLAGSDPQRAADTWGFLRLHLHGLPPAASAAVTRRIGLAFAYRLDPEGRAWLDSLPDEDADEAVREWRILLALRARDWTDVLARISALDKSERSAERWRYWRARALAATGRDEDALPILRRLAGERSYYGFLAADRLHLPYRFADQRLEFSSASLHDIEERAGVLRARELYALGRVADARREWMRAIARMDDREQARAAKLAESWGWYGPAIITLGRTPFLDDLELRFPLAYRSSVLGESRRQGINPAWLFALVRQESAFMPDARSPAGALGLMQLMPGTGRQLARSLDISLHDSWQLLDEDTSIRLGSAYVRKLLDRLQNHPVLATAAYNAGPRRVMEWLPTGGEMPADIWIDTIPFGETRRYVQRVSAYTAIYEMRLGEKPVRLGEHLTPIPPLAATAGTSEPDRGALERRTAVAVSAHY